MNFVFISPHFPHTYWQFCRRLKQKGVRVLGIADTHYDLLQSVILYMFYLSQKGLPLAVQHPEIP